MDIRMAYLKRHLIIIDREAGSNALGSVRPSVCLFACLFACLSALSRLNRFTFDPDFWYKG